MRFTIKAKLLGGFGAIVLLLTLTSLLGLSSISTINDLVDNIMRRIYPKVDLAFQLDQKLLEISRAQKLLILAEDQKEVAAQAEVMQQAGKRLDAARDKLRELEDGQGKTLVDRFSAKWEQYVALNKEIIALATRNSDVLAANLCLADGQAAYERCVGLLQKVASQSYADQQRAPGEPARLASQRAHLAEKIQLALVTLQRDERSLILQSSAKDAQETAKRIESLKSEVNADLSSLDRLATPELQGALAELRGAWSRFAEINQRAGRLESLSLAELRELAGLELEARRLLQAAKELKAKPQD